MRRDTSKRYPPVTQEPRFLDPTPAMVLPSSTKSDFAGLFLLYLECQSLLFPLLNLIQLKPPISTLAAREPDRRDF